MQFGPETVPIDANVFNLFVAGALGMLLGLEREWSNKSAGIRTFTLTSLVGVAAATIGQTVLLALGGLLVLTQGMLLGLRGVLTDVREGPADEESGLALTTSTSLLVAYVVGVLVGSDYVLVGVVIAITSSFLLVLRRELHQFAKQLSHQEVRGAAEFAIIAFVVYPLLPSGTYGPWNAIDPQLIWMLVIAVSAIGFANYAIMQRYGGRGMLITGFFGGLVNSTAVIGEIANRAKANLGVLDLAVATILVADAAMAIRNLIIVVAFVPQSAFSVGLPLGLIAVGGVLLTGYERNWRGEMDLDLDSPFSSANALTFGVLFLIVLVATAGAQQMFGTAGFLVTSFLSGLLSSGTTTTTAVSLTSTGQISPSVAAQGVLAGTLASILVKVWLAVGINRKLFRPVTLRSAYLSMLGLVGVLAVHFL
ncbi:MgtC/SapB family protein [Halobellus inordinatus]|uniref:MgtC/SapB family protein n=1 Tax=Halobellus inordinatus TaxID=1126236 RepID=UPI00210E8E5A|nr:MgtC/SapB family protein [Halobellus inordinatus]